MGACKTKAFQADLGIFAHIPICSHILRHNHIYSGITQAYSKPYVTLVYTEPCCIRTQNLRHIQKADTVRTRDIFRTLSNILNGAFDKNS